MPELPSFYNDLWLTGMGCDADTVQLNKDPVARRMFPKSAAAKAAAAKDDLNRVKEKYRRFNEIVFGDLPDKWTLIGASILIATGLYVLYREGIRRREVVAQQIEG